MAGCGQRQYSPLPPHLMPRIGVCRESSHQSGEVSMASFCQVPSATSTWPCSLRALEEQNFLFQLQAPEQPPDSTKEGLEVPLIAVVQWSTPKLPFTSSIYTHYRLPSIRLARPRFVMTAECESPVVLHRRFVVTYTLINNLQDFLAVRLVWTPESAAAGKKLACDECRATQDTQDSIVCHTPLNNLGFSRKGSARTFCVTFQALRAGLFELSQHMKLKLQFTASVSNPPPEARPVSRKSSPGSPAVRELVGRHQASLGRSQSFSHQQPARGHLLRYCCPLPTLLSSRSFSDEIFIVLCGNSLEAKREGSSSPTHPKTEVRTAVDVTIKRQC
ncbi:uncharacterized protein C7orf43 homolog isoform X1 [Python bivittatus]|uniref:Uncharacterized protein C7orf43 homolog isoform X1 n=1 Tax=Python bivittatus TaxID=176946 RepID=A0A9F5N461_PYTBI|nr:uncharacterized protein C7orf43 homolog isoform X1 [Python bivittatus]